MKSINLIFVLFFITYKLKPYKLSKEHSNILKEEINSLL